MKYSVSFLLLLALAASNGQMEPPGRGPISRPGATPGSPARPAPPGRTPNAPAPQTPSAPTRPNPQQNPRAPPQPPQSRPVPNEPSVPGRPQAQQNPRAPPSATATTRNPAANNPTRAPPGNNNNAPTSRTTTTTARTTSRSSIDNDSPGVNIPTDRPDSFPTAPNIAPPPQVHFPDQNIPNIPNLPQMPTFPGGREGQGRMDARCPRNHDSRNQIQFQHESDCASYFRCGENGFAFEHRCPEGLHWNAMRSFCDLPGNAGCQNGAPLPRPQPPVNNQPRYVHPIVIPMAPRT